MKKLITALVLLLSCAQVYSKTVKSIVVAQDGSGNFKTVQEALNTVPKHNTERIEIFIKKGVYKEKLKLDTTQHMVSLIGESLNETILTYDDFSGKKAADGSTHTTKTTASFFIFADDFLATNITFENTAGEVGQAVAVMVYGNRAVFVNCRFLGNQDTLYTQGQQSNQYYKNCYIEGTTDFIFGFSVAVFDNCHIHSKKNSYITAASTPEGNSYGYVFINCKLTAAEGINEVYLGRPWRPFAKTVFINTEMGSHILPEGWHNWNKPDAEKTSLYAEYNSKGMGGNTEKRVLWSHQLSKKDKRNYKIKTVLADTIGWTARK
ncbi:pectin esterase [Solitalea longa]|uniref:Pectinesterase n=1 Tax=Solitalea longa TaxID=2079460 RepID=A0A2S5A0J8_9SPHI|nr:pectinesterase family protein [Solitalea longa]POY35839.1 pectin esterase [Solitalea longa]